MGDYVVEIYAAKRTHYGPDGCGDEGGSYHALGDNVILSARNALSAMQKVVKYCRFKKINPCEIRLISGPDVERDE